MNREKLTAVTQGLRVSFRTYSATATLPEVKVAIVAGGTKEVYVWKDGDWWHAGTVGRTLARRGGWEAADQGLTFAGYFPTLKAAAHKLAAERAMQVKFGECTCAPSALSLSRRRWHEAGCPLAPVPFGRRA